MLRGLASLVTADQIEVTFASSMPGGWQCLVVATMALQLAWVKQECPVGASIAGDTAVFGGGTACSSGSGNDELRPGFGGWQRQVVASWRCS